MEMFYNPSLSLTCQPHAEGNRASLQPLAVLVHVLLSMVPGIGPEEGFPSPPPLSLVSGIMNSARAFWVGNKLEARGRGYSVLLVTFHGGDVHHLYKCPT